MFADCAVVKLEYWSTTQTQQVSVENVNDLGELQTDDGGSLLMGILNTRAVREICDVPCSPIPMTRGSCSCHKHIINSMHGVSWPPVLDWNDLPPELRRPGVTFDSFRQSLKSHLFGY